MNKSTLIAISFAGSLLISGCGTDTDVNKDIEIEMKIQEIKNEAASKIASMMKHCYKTVYAVPNNNVFLTDKYRKVKGYMPPEKMYEYLKEYNNIINNEQKVREYTFLASVNVTVKSCNTYSKKVARKYADIAADRISYLTQTDPTTINTKDFRNEIVWLASKKVIDDVDFTIYKVVLKHMYDYVKNDAFNKIERCVWSQPIMNVHPRVLVARPEFIALTVNKCSSGVYPGLLDSNDIGKIGEKVGAEVYRRAKAMTFGRY